MLQASISSDICQKKTHTILHIARASKTNIYRYVRWLHFISIIAAALVIICTCGVQQNVQCSVHIHIISFQPFQPFLSFSFSSVFYGKPKTERDSICLFSCYSVVVIQCNIGCAFGKCFHWCVRIFHFITNRKILTKNPIFFCRHLHSHTYNVFL